MGKFIPSPGIQLFAEQKERAYEIATKIKAPKLPKGSIGGASLAINPLKDIDK